jgi:hypothetical protein
MGLKHRGGLGGLGGLRGLHVSPNVCLGDTLVSTRVNIRKENGREIKERRRVTKRQNHPQYLREDHSTSSLHPFIPSSLHPFIPSSLHPFHPWNFPRYSVAYTRAAVFGFEDRARTS